MNVHFALIGLLFGLLQGYDGPSCYNPPPDLCKTEIPEIHSLETRDPSYEVNNVTIDWRFCDVYAIDTNKWYKSKLKMSTSCPSVYMCGAKFPIWMNGSNPKPKHWLVNRTSCVRGFDSCCVNFMAYCFVDLPYGCHQRYCFDRDPASAHKLSRIADKKSTRIQGSRNAQHSTNGSSIKAKEISINDETLFDSAASNCFSFTSDICQIEMSDIPSLQKRNSSNKFNNETLNLPFCDKNAIDKNKWYKSKSKITTSCPLMYMCSTKFPIWIKGSNPKPRHGLVNRTSCVRDFDSCCVNTYRLTAVNCRKFMAYCFVDLLNGCHKRYCFDQNPSIHKLTQASRIADKKSARIQGSKNVQRKKNDLFAKAKEIPTSDFLPWVTESPTQQEWSFS